MKIAIIGTGYVGLVTGACLASKGHDVCCLDVDAEKMEQLKQGKMPFYEPGLEELVAQEMRSGRLTFGIDKSMATDAQIVFLCVGTPPKDDGSADLMYIFEATEQLAPHLSDGTILVSKSTVPVGTGIEIRERLNAAGKQDVFVASNPEFLREGKAIDDFMNPDRIVIGVESDRAAQLLRELYESFNCPMVQTTIESSEMIKYAANAFLATKISYINEIANVCEFVGADVRDVALGVGLDPRIGTAFLNAGIGYGGSCFPKDVRALDQIAGARGYDFKLIKAAIGVNQEQRWRFYERVIKVMKGDKGDERLEGKKVAILGLAFKAGTDDIRESIGVDFARKFVEDGAQVSVYDPRAMENARRILTGAEFCASIEQAVIGVDAIIIATEWPEFRDFDYMDVVDQVRQKLIFDGRNLLDGEKLKEQGFLYHGIGF